MLALTQSVLLPLQPFAVPPVAVVVVGVTLVPAFDAVVTFSPMPAIYNDDTTLTIKFAAGGVPFTPDSAQLTVSFPAVLGQTSPKVYDVLRDFTSTIVGTYVLPVHVDWVGEATFELVSVVNNLRRTVRGVLSSTT